MGSLSSETHFATKKSSCVRRSSAWLYGCARLIPPSLIRSVDGSSWRWSHCVADWKGRLCDMAVAPAERVSSTVRRVRRLVIHDASLGEFGLSSDAG